MNDPTPSERVDSLVERVAGQIGWRPDLEPDSKKDARYTARVIIEEVADAVEGQGITDWGNETYVDIADWLRAQAREDG